MRKTLIDVMGEVKGESFYSDEWLLERVQYHIDLKERACIFLSIDNHGEITGQAIARVEEENGEEFGFFSTLYVDDKFRRQGIAQDLIRSVLTWCNEKNLKRVTYNTAEGHSPIIELFSRFGLKEILKSDGMIKLALEIA